MGNHLVLGHLQVAGRYGGDEGALLRRRRIMGSKRQGSHVAEEAKGCHRPLFLETRFHGFVFQATPFNAGPKTNLGQTRCGAQVSVSQASIGCRAVRSKQPKSTFAVHENAEGGRIVGEKPRAKSCAKTQVDAACYYLGPCGRTLASSW
ncbi:hypothetical protein GW17_00057488 [Ensete ventricosum]|nr:hypothetical protein GW17_00057488 [Ensete ventricosum]